MCIQKKKNLQSQINESNFKSNFLTGGLASLAILLIGHSFLMEGWWQNLLLGLGTGVATSALVSFVFYFNDKQTKLREQLQNRIIFMSNFKILFYNLLFLIDFDVRADCTINLETFIKNQHRWFHDYYKKMFAHSDSQIETDHRAEQLEQFMSAICMRIPPCFEYNTAWRNSTFSEWQRSELNRFYTGIKNIEIYLKQQKYQSAFLEFAYVLETLKRMPSEFDELESFKEIEFSYSHSQELQINLDKFEEKEQNFKSAREFNEIRNRNYRTKYSPKAKN